MDGVEHMQSEWVSLDVHEVLELVFQDSALKADAGRSEPRTFAEAVSRSDGDHYLQAAIDEVKPLVDNGTFTNTELVRFRYFVGTQNQLQWHCKCCVSHA